MFGRRPVKGQCLSSFCVPLVLLQKLSWVVWAQLLQNIFHKASGDRAFPDLSLDLRRSGSMLSLPQTSRYFRGVLEKRILSVIMWVISFCDGAGLYLLKIRFGGLQE